MRNGLLCSLLALLAGVPALAADPPLPVTLGRPVALNEAVHLQAPVVANSDPGIVRTGALEDSSAGPLTIYRAQAAPPGDPLFPQPASPGGPPPGTPGPPGPPMTACPAPACPPPQNTPRFWVDGEFLMWWVKNGPTPFGNSADYGLFPGLRLDAGAWLDPAEKWGIEGSGFFLGRQSTNLGAGATAGIPLPDVLVLGGAAANTDTQVYGADFNGLYSLYRDRNFHADLIGGLRYLGLQEDLKAYAVGTLLLPTGEIEDGTLTQRLTTQNNFYGAQLGARAGWQFDRWFTDITGKVALGVSREGLTYDGLATGIDGATDGFQFRQIKSEFAVLPEVYFRVGYNFTKNIRAYVGYDVIYLSSVARPGDQNFFNLSSVKSSGYWAQGLNFGVEFSF